MRGEQGQDLDRGRPEEVILTKDGKSHGRIQWAISGRLVLVKYGRITRKNQIKTNDD